MQNAHCGGKVMDTIYFLVSYMPIWSCRREFVRLEPCTVGRTDSNEHINKKPKIYPLCPLVLNPLMKQRLQRHLYLDQFMAIIWLHLVPTNTTEWVL